MINIDDKYYYIDTTSMDSEHLSTLLLDIFNVSLFYMEDTESITLYPTSQLQSGKVNIPIELLEDVLEGREEKDIFEKYGEIVGEMLIFFCYAIKGILI